VSVERDERGVFATIGGGCQIKHALDELRRQGNLTLPTLGLISEQAMAGAMSTGTHGSGRHSLSHYAVEVRIATYDPATGEPVIRTIAGGNELKAARCSLGCLGVILSVKVPVREQYLIDEHLRLYASLEEVLAAEKEFPIQQFYLLPWSWKLLAQHRRESAGPRSWLAPLYRWYWFLTIDVGLHVLLKLLVNVVRLSALVRFFYRWLVLVFVIRGWRVVDRSDQQLIMEHELFRHIETEIFVRRGKLPAAMVFARELLEACSNPTNVSPHLREQMSDLGLADELAAAAGHYVHHYAICVRKVLPDATLISPASDDGQADSEPWYAISFISYTRPDQRDGFFRFAKLATDAMAALFGGRPHWGKHCPLALEQIRGLYPLMQEFQRVADHEFDPGGLHFGQRLLGVPRAQVDAAAAVAD
jgi:hypothetical protein